MCNNDVKVSLVQLSYAKAVELCDEGRLVPFLCCLLNEGTNFMLGGHEADTKILGLT